MDKMNIDLILKMIVAASLLTSILVASLRKKKNASTALAILFSIYLIIIGSL